MGQVTRVLFVNPGLAMGGAEHSLLLLLDGLKTRGVQATVTLFGDGPFRDRLLALGLPTVRVGPPRSVRSVTRYRSPRAPLRAAALALASAPTVIRLAVLARRTRADLIHTNGLKAHLLAGLAGRMVGVPVVWHFRDFPPSGIVGDAFRLAARRLPALVLTNSNAVAAAIGSPEADAVKIITVYNPVDLRRFHPGLPRGRIRRELRLAPDVPLVGLVAHLTPWKGHEQFLGIGLAVLQAVPTAHFVIAGGPIYETDGHAGYPELLRRRVGTLGLEGKLAFLGSRDDIPEVLADLDVLVHCPAAPEPFGRALAEAMAVGCPVVAARCGGIPEVVEDRVTGFLVPPMDVEGFASSVVQLLEDPILRHRIGRSGRDRAEALFGAEAHASRVLEAYRPILADRGGRP